MSTPRFFKCRCQHCQGPIEFPVEGVGTNVACPHCGVETALNISEPPATDRAAVRTRAWAIGGMIVLVMMLIAAFVAVHLLRDIAPRVRRTQVKNIVQQLPATPADVTTVPIGTAATSTAALQPEWLLTNELSISPVGFATQPGSTLRHATGSVLNVSTRKRFGLVVELQMLDGDGNGLQQIRDYRPVLEPSARWDFRAVVLNPKSKSARITAVREER